MLHSFLNFQSIDIVNFCNQSVNIYRAHEMEDDGICLKGWRYSVKASHDYLPCVPNKELPVWLKFFLTLQEWGFKLSIISYGCLINLYVKVSAALVYSSHVLQLTRAVNDPAYCLKQSSLSLLEDWAESIARLKVCHLIHLFPFWVKASKALK